MPAAELTKLREQIHHLAGLFDLPDDFLRALRDLFELYAHHVYRPGQSVTNLPIVPSYRPPSLVIRRLELDLSPLCISHDAKALAVIDRLWREPYLEPRLLAMTLFGQVPLSQAESILERLRAWAQPQEDRILLEALLERGTARLRHEGPDALLELYDTWLISPDPAYRLIGLKALLPLIHDPEFENIPPIFSMIFPLVQTVSAATFGDLSAVLLALAERTPTETAYFLRQILTSPYQANTPRLVRRIIPLLSESQQEGLKGVLKSKMQ
jgi:hypothetical protein